MFMFVYVYLQGGHQCLVVPASPVSLGDPVYDKGKDKQLNLSEDWTSDTVRHPNSSQGNNISYFAAPIPWTYSQLCSAFISLISLASRRGPTDPVPRACYVPMCVSWVLISCLAPSRLSRSQEWLGHTVLLSQPLLGRWWQESRGHSFNSEIKWEIGYLPCLPVIQWDPEDQASPGPEGKYKSDLVFQTGRRGFLKSVWISVWMCLRWVLKGISTYWK